MRGGADNEAELEKLATEAEANELKMLLLASEQGRRAFPAATRKPPNQQYQPSPLIDTPEAKYERDKSYALALIPNLNISEKTQQQLIENIAPDSGMNDLSQRFIENIIKLHEAYHSKKTILPPNLVEILGSEQRLDELIDVINTMDK